MLYKNKYAMSIILPSLSVWLVTGGLLWYLPDKCQCFQKPQPEAEAWGEEAGFLGTESLVRQSVIL